MTRTAEPRTTTAPDATTSVASGARLAGRTTHPWAWWGWAVGAAVVAMFTTNPLLLALVITAVLLVTLARRSDAPWARSVGAFLVLGLAVIGFRVILMALLGGSRSGIVLFTLPELQLPTWMAGIRIGGPVTLNAVLGALYDGLRLATILICVGCANALANPRQALKSVPAALNQLSVAVVIALSVAPQLVESIGRVRRARRLRGGAGKGFKAVVSIMIPVMQDALERSMRLATAMESRGYGRTLRTDRTPASAATSVLLVAGLVGLVFCTYALFAIADAQVWAPIGMVLASAVLLVGLHLSGRGQRISRYRPHPWRWRDTAVVACGGVAALVVVRLATLTPAALHPGVHPLAWPPLTTPMLVIVALLALPLLLTEAPVPTTRAESR
ncbi:energy-coupling factor transporter transmembrane component T [Propionibacteriaceae bacterium Y1923]